MTKKQLTKTISAAGSKNQTKSSSADEITKNAKRAKTYAYNRASEYAPNIVNTVSSLHKDLRDIHQWLKNSSPFRSSPGNVPATERKIGSYGKILLGSLKDDVTHGRLLTFAATNANLEKILGGLGDAEFDDTYDAVVDNYEESSGYKSKEIDDALNVLLGNVTEVEAATTEATIEAVGNAANAMMETSVRASEYVAKTVVSGHNIATSHMLEVQSKTNTHLQEISNKLETILESNAKTVSFQEQTFEFYSKTEATLNQLLDVTKAQYDSMSEWQLSKFKEDYDFTRNGFDFSKYRKYLWDKSLAGQMIQFTLGEYAPILKFLGINVPDSAFGGGDIRIDPVKGLLNNTVISRQVVKFDKIFGVKLREMFNQLAEGKFTTGNESVDSLIELGRQFGLFGERQKGIKLIDRDIFSSDLKNKAPITVKTLRAVEEFIPDYLSRIQADVNIIADGLVNGSFTSETSEDIQTQILEGINRLVELNTPSVPGETTSDRSQGNGIRRKASNSVHRVDDMTAPPEPKVRNQKTSHSETSAQTSIHTPSQSIPNDEISQTRNEKLKIVRDTRSKLKNQFNSGSNVLYTNYESGKLVTGKNLGEDLINNITSRKDSAFNEIFKDISDLKGDNFTNETNSKLVEWVNKYGTTSGGALPAKALTDLWKIVRGNSGKVDYNDKVITEIEAAAAATQHAYLKFVQNRESYINSINYLVDDINSGASKYTQYISNRPDLANEFSEFVDSIRYERINYNRSKSTIDEIKKDLEFYKKKKLVKDGAPDLKAAKDLDNLLDLYIKYRKRVDDGNSATIEKRNFLVAQEKWKNKYSEYGSGFDFNVVNDVDSLKSLYSDDVMQPLTFDPLGLKMLSNEGQIMTIVKNPKLWKFIFGRNSARTKAMLESTRDLTEADQNSETPSEGSGTSLSAYGHSTVSNFNQRDSRWSNVGYGINANGTISTIGTGGCGPTALAEVARSFGINTDPSKVASLFKQYGYDVNGGTSSAAFTEGAAKLGLYGRAVNLKDIADGISRGQKYIVSGQNGKFYTREKHIISITGYDPKTGKLIVHNPLKNTPTMASITDVMEGAQNAWEISNGSVGSGGDGIAKVGEGIEKVAENVSNAKKQYNVITEEAARMSGNYAGKIDSAAGNIIDVVANSVENPAEFGRNLRGFFGGFFDGVKRQAVSIPKAVGDVNVEEFVNNGVAKARSFEEQIPAMAAELTSNVRQIAAGTTSTAKGLFDTTKGFVSNLIKSEKLKKGMEFAFGEKDDNGYYKGGLFGPALINNLVEAKYKVLHKLSGREYADIDNNVIAADYNNSIFGRGGKGSTLANDVRHDYLVGKYGKNYRANAAYQALPEHMKEYDDRRHVNLGSMASSYDTVDENGKIVDTYDYGKYATVGLPGSRAKVVGWKWYYKGWVFVYSNTLSNKKTVRFVSSSDILKEKELLQSYGLDEDTARAEFNNQNRLPGYKLTNTILNYLVLNLEPKGFKWKVVSPANENITGGSLFSRFKNKNGEAGSTENLLVAVEDGMDEDDEVISADGNKHRKPGGRFAGAVLGFILTGGNPLGAVAGAMIGRGLNTFSRGRKANGKSGILGLIGKAIGAVRKFLLPRGLKSFIAGVMGFVLTGGNPLGALAGAQLSRLSPKSEAQINKELRKKALSDAFKKGGKAEYKKELITEKAIKVAVKGNKEADSESFAKEKAGYRKDAKDSKKEAREKAHEEYKKKLEEVRENYGEEAAWSFALTYHLTRLKFGAKRALSTAVSGLGKVYGKTAHSNAALITGLGAAGYATLGLLTGNPMFGLAFGGAALISTLLKGKKIKDDIKNSFIGKMLNKVKKIKRKFSAGEDEDDEKRIEDQKKKIVKKIKSDLGAVIVGIRSHKLKPNDPLNLLRNTCRAIFLWYHVKSVTLTGKDGMEYTIEPKDMTYDDIKRFYRSDDDYLADGIDFTNFDEAVMIVEKENSKRIEAVERYNEICDERERERKSNLRQVELELRTNEENRKRLYTDYTDLMNPTGKSNESPEADKPKAKKVKAPRISTVQQEESENQVSTNTESTGQGYGDIAIPAIGRASDRDDILSNGVFDSGIAQLITAIRSSTEDQTTALLEDDEKDDARAKKEAKRAALVAKATALKGEAAKKAGSDSTEAETRQTLSADGTETRKGILERIGEFISGGGLAKLLGVGAGVGLGAWFLSTDAGKKLAKSVGTTINSLLTPAIKFLGKAVSNIGSFIFEKLKSIDWAGIGKGILESGATLIDSASDNKTNFRTEDDRGFGASNFVDDVTGASYQDVIDQNGNVVGTKKVRNLDQAQILGPLANVAYKDAKYFITSGGKSVVGSAVAGTGKAIGSKIPIVKNVIGSKVATNASKTISKLSSALSEKLDDIIKAIITKVNTSDLGRSITRNTSGSRLFDALDKFKSTILNLFNKPEVGKYVTENQAMIDKYMTESAINSVSLAVDLGLVAYSLCAGGAWQVNNLFGIDESKVDSTMRIISSIMSSLPMLPGIGLAFALLDVVAIIIAAALGVNVKQKLAVAIYDGVTGDNQQKMDSLIKAMKTTETERQDYNALTGKTLSNDEFFEQIDNTRGGIAEAYRVGVQGTLYKIWDKRFNRNTQSPYDIKNQEAANAKATADFIDWYVRQRAITGKASVRYSTEDQFMADREAGIYAKEVEDAKRVYIDKFGQRVATVQELSGFRDEINQAGGPGSEGYGIFSTTNSKQYQTLTQIKDAITNIANKLSDIRIDPNTNLQKEAAMQTAAMADWIEWSVLDQVKKSGRYVNEDQYLSDKALGKFARERGIAVNSYMDKFGKTSPTAADVISLLANQKMAQINQVSSKESEGYGDIHFSQKDSRWSGASFGITNSGRRTTIGDGGCGPTALATVANQLGARTNPASVASMARRYGYTADGGSSADLFTSGARRLGLNSRQVNLNSIPRRLAAGQKLIVSGKGGPSYTKSGHIISLRRGRNGRTIVDDPLKSRSESRNLKSVLRGARKAWAVGYGDLSDTDTVLSTVVEYYGEPKPNTESKVIYDKIHALKNSGVWDFLTVDGGQSLEQWLLENLKDKNSSLINSQLDASIEEVKNPSAELKILSKLKGKIEKTKSFLNNKDNAWNEDEYAHNLATDFGNKVTMADKMEIDGYFNPLYHYPQGSDKPWAYKSIGFSGSTFSSAGCHPTSIANAISNASGADISPILFTRWLATVTKDIDPKKIGMWGSDRYVATGKGLKDTKWFDKVSELLYGSPKESVSDLMAISVRGGNYNIYEPDWFLSSSAKPYSSEEGRAAVTEHLRNVLRGGGAISVGSYGTSSMYPTSGSGNRTYNDGHYTAFAGYKRGGDGVEYTQSIDPAARTSTVKGYRSTPLTEFARTMGNGGNGARWIAAFPKAKRSAEEIMKQMADDMGVKSLSQFYASADIVPNYGAYTGSGSGSTGGSSSSGSSGVYGPTLPNFDGLAGNYIGPNKDNLSSDTGIASILANAGIMLSGIASNYLATLTGESYKSVFGLGGTNGSGSSLNYNLDPQSQPEKYESLNSIISQAQKTNNYQLGYLYDGQNGVSIVENVDSSKVGDKEYLKNVVAPAVLRAMLDNEIKKLSDSDKKKLEDYLNNPANIIVGNSIAEEQYAASINNDPLKKRAYELILDYINQLSVQIRNGWSLSNMNYKYSGSRGSGGRWYNTIVERFNRGRKDFFYLPGTLHMDQERDYVRLFMDDSEYAKYKSYKDQGSNYVLGNYRVSDGFRRYGIYNVSKDNEKIWENADIEKLLSGFSGDINNEDERNQYIWNKLHMKGFNDIETAGIMGNFQAESNLNPESVEGQYYPDYSNYRDKIFESDEGMDSWAERLFQHYDNNKPKKVPYSKEGYVVTGADGKKHYRIGIGLAGWTASLTDKLINAARQSGKPWQDLDHQLDFFADNFLRNQYNDWNYSTAPSAPGGLTRPEYLKDSESPEQAANRFYGIYESGSSNWYSENSTRGDYARDLYNKFSGSEGYGNLKSIDIQSLPETFDKESVGYGNYVDDDLTDSLRFSSTRKYSSGAAYSTPTGPRVINPSVDLTKVEDVTGKMLKALEKIVVNTSKIEGTKIIENHYNTSEGKGDVETKDTKSKVKTEPIVLPQKVINENYHDRFRHIHDTVAKSSRA